MKPTQKIAIAAGALTLAATGIAAAADPPDAADDGLTKASEQVGVELPATQDSHPPVTADELDDDAVESEVEDDADELEAEGEGGGPEGNHGAEVSAVAKVNDPETGNEHGIAVSEVARQGHGQGPSAEKTTGQG